MSLMPRLTSLGKFLVGTGVFWFFLASYIALSSIPFNPLSLSFKNSQLYSLIPEGWGFFTRDPKEPNILVYHQEKNNWILDTRSNSDPIFLFGLSRKNRRIQGEIQTMVKELNDSLWIKRPGLKMDFNVSKITLLINPFTHHIITGDFIIIKQERIPWAWSANYKKLSMPYKILRVHIK